MTQILRFESTDSASYASPPSRTTNLLAGAPTPHVRPVQSANVGFLMLHLIEPLNLLLN